MQIKIDVNVMADGKPALSVCDNGGGMDRGAMHRMMSFGVSRASGETQRIGTHIFCGMSNSRESTPVPFC